MSSDFTIKIAGENSLIIYFSDTFNTEVANTVRFAEQLIRQQMKHLVVDLIPSYASILVVFDLLSTDHHVVRNELRVVLKGLFQNITNSKNVNVVELPVYYSQESGPELSLIAKNANLTTEEVIQIHQAQTYDVYAIGFAPGFAYLGEVDERITTPRLSTPRLKISKGAVGIADNQTAVYPSVSPGGWNIIGLCPLNMFDANAKQTMPVNVGDKVKFKAITKTEFIALGGKLSNDGDGFK